MVTTGAEMPILNGLRSAATEGAASARPSKVAMMRTVRVNMVSSHNGLETGIAPVNGRPVAIGRQSGLHVLLDQAPDAVLDRMETRLALHAQRPRALDLDRDALLDPSGPPREHDDAVRQIDRLVDLMGDEQHGLLRFHPDLQE